MLVDLNKPQGIVIVRNTSGYARMIILPPMRITVTVKGKNEITYETEELIAKYCKNCDHFRPNHKAPKLSDYISRYMINKFNEIAGSKIQNTTTVGLEHFLKNYIDYDQKKKWEKQINCTYKFIHDLNNYQKLCEGGQQIRHCGEDHNLQKYHHDELQITTMPSIFVPYYGLLYYPFEHNLYAYVISNVNSSGEICWGNVNRSRSGENLKTDAQVIEYTELFWGNVFNGDYCEKRNGDRLNVYEVMSNANNHSWLNRNRSQRDYSIVDFFDHKTLDSYHDGISGSVIDFKDRHTTIIYPRNTNKKVEQKELVTV